MKLIIRLLAVILIFASLFAVYGCQETPADNQETQGAQKTENAPFDPENPYLVMATDIQNGCVAVINLDAEDPMDPDAYYWYWMPDSKLGWKYASKLGRGNLSDAKFRWSELHQSYVLLVTGASGYIGIAEYPSGKCIWESLNTGVGPHAIEMLPSGDLVVACSGAAKWETEGKVTYYHTEDGKVWNITSEQSLPSAHGVLWDPEYNVVWANGYHDLVAYDVVDGSDGKPVLSKRTDKMGALLVAGSGHDLTPDYSDPNYLWITCEQSVQKYDKKADKVLNNYTYSDKVFGKHRVKGVTNFFDGAVAYAQTGATTNDWLETFCVVWPMDLEGKESVVVEYKSQDGSFWNKVRNFDPDYQ